MGPSTWFLLLALASPTASQPAVCAYDRSAMMALDLDVFDQDPQRGFRRLLNRPACETAAADLVADYRRTLSKSLRGGELRRLAWHEGQLRAMAGESARAVELMTASRSDGQDGVYVDATIAFLRRDHLALWAARDRLAALPQPATFTQAAAEYQARGGPRLTWPPNLDIIDALITCFDRPYADAYGLAVCRANKH